MTVRLCAGAAALALMLAPTAANATADVVFVMDSSGSLSNANFNTEKLFVSGVIDQITGNTGGAGVVQFGTAVKTLPIVTLSSTNRTKLKTDVINLPHMATSTYTLNALNSTISAFDTYNNSANERFAFIITDGVPSPSTQNPCGTSTAAATFRDNFTKSGIKAYLIAIGSAAITEPLSCLTDNNAAGRVLSLQTTADLAGTTSAVAAIINGKATSLTPVPEPATWATMMAGFTLIGWAMRRRRPVAAVSA